MNESRKPYHHGDLRAALLAAGEQVLAEKGTEKFSLREVARRVGVSHSAPAHHFGDSATMLAAMAAEGYGRLLDHLRRGIEAAGPDPRERHIGSGLGYIEFALSSPALFRLMFGPERLGADCPDLARAAGMAYDLLSGVVADVHGGQERSDLQQQADILASWSIAHGLADLLASGLLDSVRTLPPQERQGFCRMILSRLIV